MIPREWIISHRCSWMAVYVSCCNAQSKYHSDPCRGYNPRYTKVPLSIMTNMCYMVELYVQEY
jgi:hypothetical protein